MDTPLHARRRSRCGSIDAEAPDETAAREHRAAVIARMIAAIDAAQRAADAASSSSTKRAVISHHARTTFLTLYDRGDLGDRQRRRNAAGEPLRVSTRRLAARSKSGWPRRDSLLARRRGAFHGRGVRLPVTSGRRPSSVCLHRGSDAGDSLRLGPLNAIVTTVLGHPRLVDFAFSTVAAEVWEGLARHGRPIQYAYVQRTAGDLGHVDAHRQPTGGVRAAVGQASSSTGLRIRIDPLARSGVSRPSLTPPGFPQQATPPSTHCCRSMSRTKSRPRPPALIA